MQRALSSGHWKWVSLSETSLRSGAALIWGRARDGSYSMSASFLELRSINPFVDARSCGNTGLRPTAALSPHGSQTSCTSRGA